MTDDTTAPENGTEAGPARRRRPILPWVVAGVGVLVVAAAIAIPVSLTAAQKAADEKAAAQAEADAKAAEVARLATFREQLARCGVASAGSSTVQILDGGEAVQLARVTKYDGPSYEALTCFLAGLKAPSAIEAEISQTRALDGRQSDEWDGYSISWSYHPDDGASILVQHEE